MDTEGMPVLITQDCRIYEETRLGRYGSGGDLTGKYGIYLGYYFYELESEKCTTVDHLIKAVPGMRIGNQVLQSLEHCIEDEEKDEVWIPNPLIAVPVGDDINYIWGRESYWVEGNVVDALKGIGLNDADVVALGQEAAGAFRQKLYSKIYGSSRN